MGQKFSCLFTFTMQSCQGCLPFSAPISRIIEVYGLERENSILFSDPLDYKFTVLKLRGL